MSKKRDWEIKKGRIKLYHGQTCVSFIIVSADQASLSVWEIACILSCSKTYVSV